MLLVAQRAGFRPARHDTALKLRHATLLAPFAWGYTSELISLLMGADVVATAAVLRDTGWRGVKKSFSSRFNSPGAS